MSIVVLYIALFIGVIPLSILFYRKKAYDIQLPAILFIWLTAIAVVYEFVGTLLLKKTTTYWFYLYDLLEFIALYYFFYKIFQKRYKPLLYAFGGLFTVAYLLSSLHLDKFNALKAITLNSIPTVIFVLTCCGLWFKNLFDKADVPNLWQNTHFYFVSGFIIYYSSTFFLFLLSNSIFSSENLYIYDYWFVNVVATLILRIFMIIGVWKVKPD